MKDEISNLLSSLFSHSRMLSVRISLKKDQMAEDENDKLCFFEIENELEEMRICIYKIKEIQNSDEKKPVIETE